MRYESVYIPYTSGSKDCTASLTALINLHRPGLLALRRAGLGSLEAGGDRSSGGIESMGSPDS